MEENKRMIKQKSRSSKRFRQRIYRHRIYLKVVTRRIIIWQTKMALGILILKCIRAKVYPSSPDDAVTSVRDY